MMKILSERTALARLNQIISNFRSEISNYESRAKSCLTCDVQGSCCLDAHFVNVRISRLEAVAITKVLDRLPDGLKQKIDRRIDQSIQQYGLKGGGNMFACPLFEKGLGCLVHKDGKPLPCIAHACYENAADLPPDELLDEHETRVERLDRQTYGRAEPLLPLPVAIKRVST